MASPVRPPYRILQSPANPPLWPQTPADATYIRSDMVGGDMVGTMYTIPWTVLYRCLSIQCIEAANTLVGEIERLGLGLG